MLNVKSTLNRYRLRAAITPDRRKINLYRDEINGSYIKYSLMLDGRCVAEYESRIAAMTRFKSLAEGLENYHHKPIYLDDFKILSERVSKGSSGPISDLRFGLLAELERHSVLERGSGVKHAAACGTVARLMSDEIIPSGEQDFLNYINKCSDIIAQNAKTASNRRVLFNVYLRCLAQIANHPVVFKKHLKLYLTFKQKIISNKNQLVKLVPPVKTRQPYSKTEIKHFFNSLVTVEQLLLLCVYLSLGSRGGEAEKAHYTHISNGLYDLDSIQTKRVNGKRPSASLALRGLLKFARDEEVEFHKASLLEIGVDRKRLRPTVGTFCIISGQNPLAVSTRLGHSSMEMVIRVYAKFMPADFLPHAEYFNEPSVKIDSLTTAETGFDNFILQQLLLTTKRLSAVMFSQLKESLTQELLRESSKVDIKDDETDF